MKNDLWKFNECYMEWGKENLWESSEKLRKMKEIYRKSEKFMDICENLN